MKKHNRTKKQHYIAQGIIKIFFNKDDIYEKNIRLNKTYKVSIKDTMCMNNSYELPCLKDNFLEDLFAQTVDVDSCNVIRKIITLLDADDIDFALKKITKYIRIFLINYYKSITSLIHFSNDVTKKDESSILRMINKIFDVNYINRISEILNTGYDCYIIRTDSQGFYLSDQYMSSCSLKFKGRYANISNREIGLKDTVILFPLSKKYYILFINGLMPKQLNIKMNIINILNKEQVLKINNIIYNNSYEKCLSNNKKSLEEAKKTNSSLGDSIASIGYKSGESNTFKIKQEIFFDVSEYKLYEYYNSLDWASKKFKKCTVNSKCPCGSNIKYKKCCKSKNDRCNYIFNKMHNNQKDLIINYELGLEDPIVLPKFIGDDMKKTFDKAKNTIKVK